MNQTLENTAQDTDFTETARVIKSKVRNVNGCTLARLLNWITGENNQCRNCGSSNILEYSIIEEVIRILNPPVFGEKAKPHVYSRNKPLKYQCGKCGIENAQLGIVAESREHYDIT